MKVVKVPPQAGLVTAVPSPMNDIGWCRKQRNEVNVALFGNKLVIDQEHKCMNKLKPSKLIVNLLPFLTISNARPPKQASYSHSANFYIN